ncbi:hypothetical protein Pla108_16220 [Botrimarina colliarenosi]|uniref:DUF202 domain-containing protein n=2 Tax=Botrimarina colliarenosi TaxID=2528001 RepID=A0A5C6ALZ2_9BACT|nr:hypothetical protein Pla108_16220 [Botrimarina colliarenosi]
MPDPDSATRDRLAVTRTKLANERTLLAYIRTAVMLVASGATLWRLQPTGPIDRTLGAVTMGVGLAVLAVGLFRFYSTHGAIDGDDAPREG